ncbi:aldehyde dehydrogenase family protein [Frigoribacterium sp. CG_9.8]|uniref:aldehyde dehydrogenase family protein n=1 Tax=Frigoribacterium sp. CG_9.8 TaxID=2787733 RepID=UPI0018C9D20D|nr:aldehyde dehydrogenase family protein [Frigoribacterium sp. CG_9.8]MBG6106935.1 aldehyde dehydrogenase (NAD(P)+) [Frigoribacterium sp. CG_9.8]
MTTTDPTVPVAAVPADIVPSDVTASRASLDVAIRADLDAAIASLSAGESRWAKMTIPARITLLGSVHAAVAATADEWVDAAVRAKNLDPDSAYVGEEWISGPYVVLSSLLALQHTLGAIASGKSPLADTKLGSAPGGRVSVPVLPANPYEALLLHGFSAEVWMKPGTTESTVRASAGLGARTPTETDGVGLVLGAGNITSIPPLDVLYELVAHNRVALLKLNPVMNRMLAPYTAAFKPLIDLGLLRIVTGAGDVGGYLVNHPGISHVHITGSAVTHDVIVWGTGAGAASRKAAGTPLLTKPITSELGGVAPIIVLPGAWSKADLRYQAEHVVTQRLHNGGYNCIAGQIVVLSAQWPQREAFLAELRSALARTPDRAPWYPGSDERVGQARSSYPGAEKFGASGGRLLVDIHADDDAATLLTTEYFSPVLGVIELPGTGQAFLDTAVETVNRDFVGTLGANILGLPSTITQLGTGFENALARLDYGTIAVNTWTALGFLTPGAPWGAFPGHTLDHVQSGIGVVHNSLLLADTEKTIARGPFRPFPRSALHGEFALFPKPPWFVTARSAKKTGRLLAEFAAAPSWFKMPAIFISAFRA